MLHTLLTENRAEIIARCQARAVERTEHNPTTPAFTLGIPLFVDQIIEALRSGSTGEPILRMATQNGRDLLNLGLSIGQVVHYYGDICQSISTLVQEKAVPVGAAEFQILNKCLDDAIAEAVTEYARRREGNLSAQQTERMGFFGHELRNLLNTALLAFEALQSGKVGLTGSTGAMLGRSLRGLRQLVERSLTEVRIAAQVQNPERVLLDEFIEEVEATAAVEFKARNLELHVICTTPGLTVMVDRQILLSAVTNLLQNASKFTRPGSCVTLSLRSEEDHALIEVADECGGLAPGAEELFRSFEQRGPDRTGLGLGLSIARRAVEMSGGTLQVRNFPGVGCAFTIALPAWQGCSTKVCAGEEHLRGPDRP